MSTISFELPIALEAKAPPERRGSVRLLTAGPAGIRHGHFSALADELRAGDLVVVNTSRTLPAAVNGRRQSGCSVTVHFSAALYDGDWVVEVRPPHHATGPVGDLVGGEQVALPQGVTLTVLAPKPAGQNRLWRARIPIVGGVVPYLARVGGPITYSYVNGHFPLTDYQTIFAREPGSAEMPSAGRPFTHELVTELITHGIAVAPLTLHTGVSSQEAHEAPQPERYAVPESTAWLVNTTRTRGGRIIAVGTTVTRALESAASGNGQVSPYAGWTDLILSAERPARVVTGLITGWHAPEASHLRLLEAVAGPGLVSDTYTEALREKYLWHEFGDSCLLLP
ncbi:MAG: S-adenosylmethionine:tRNA ribosyltransferase-isomerase [Longispora sp.]|nr:S-adenosylmethionine:tRNA ribosyltransferase-isomerase [Longispora sp. (in: high G+C Gram-positive bacteria)]